MKEMRSSAATLSPYMEKNKMRRRLKKDYEAKEIKANNVLFILLFGNLVTNIIMVGMLSRSLPFKLAHLGHFVTL